LENPAFLVKNIRNQENLARFPFGSPNIIKGGHTLLFAIHKCGNTKEECPLSS